jgi:exonuclease SbcD
VPERRVFDACAVVGPEHAWFEAYAARIEQILSALVADLPATTVNLVLAHLLVDGARVGTGERPLHLGRIYGVNPQQLPSTAQYVALGHLHRPQEILAPARTFYAGSLIELDFGEREQDKRVVVFEAKPGRAVAVESVPVTAGRRLRDVSGTLEDLRRLSAAAGRDFLRVRVEADAHVPGLAERVKELLPNAVDVTVDYPRVESGRKEADGPARSRLDPAELFARYYERKNGVPPPAALETLFHAIYEEAARQ